MEELLKILVESAPNMLATGLLVLWLYQQNKLLMSTLLLRVDALESQGDILAGQVATLVANTNLAQAATSVRARAGEYGKSGIKGDVGKPGKYGV
jgi:hypothetical protein